MAKSYWELTNIAQRIKIQQHKALAESSVRSKINEAEIASNRDSIREVEVTIAKNERSVEKYRKALKQHEKVEKTITSKLDRLVEEIRRERKRSVTEKKESKRKIAIVEQNMSRLEQAQVESQRNSAAQVEELRKLLLGVSLKDEDIAQQEFVERMKVIKLAIAEYEKTKNQGAFVNRIHREGGSPAKI